MTNRIENDHYPTPIWMPQQLTKFANIHGSIFECCSGKDHAIARYFLGKGHYVLTNDLYFKNSTYQLDATSSKSWELIKKLSGTSDWVISNPPFGCQQEIIRHAYDHAKVGIAMLLRVSADEMTMTDPERYNWWADHPESLVIKMPRFSFAKSSKSGRWAVDNTYCQWFVWRKDDYIYPHSIVRLPHDRIEGFSRQPQEVI